MSSSKILFPQLSGATEEALKSFSQGSWPLNLTILLQGEGIMSSICIMYTGRSFVSKVFSVKAFILM